MCVLNKDQIGIVAATKGVMLPLRVLSVRKQGNTLFYIGTWTEEDGHVSKESQEFYEKQFEAEEALEHMTFTQTTVRKSRHARAVTAYLNQALNKELEV